jgi:hypothetical protein
MGDKGHIYGWQAAWACADAQFNGITEGIHSLGDGLDFVFVTSMNLANSLSLASPLLLLLLRRGRGRGYAATLGCCATFAWTPLPDPKYMMIGYYVWCFAQLCILSAARLGPRTLIAMVAVAVARVFLWPSP